MPEPHGYRTLELRVICRSLSSDGEFRALAGIRHKLPRSTTIAATSDCRNAAGMATYATALGHWRHTLPMPATPPPPAPIPPMSTLDAVVSALDSIIEWSIAASSRLGYFAA